MSHNAFSSCWQDENPALLSHRREREREKYIPSSQIDILNFSLLKIKDIKENTYIKNLFSP